MRKPRLIGLSLICALAISGCVANGHVRPVPPCPVPQAVPASLMQTPHVESDLRQRLLQSAPQPTRKSADSKTR